MNKTLLFSLLFLTACTRETKIRLPAQASGAETEVFSNPAFAQETEAARETAQKIFSYRQLSERAYRDQDPPELQNDKSIKRDTHGKTVACTKAEFQVNANIPNQYKEGIFAQPNAKFNSWIRFANGVGQIHHDLYADARGFSIKLMGVKGPKLLSSFANEEAFTQDFLFNNAPTFFVGDTDSAEEFFKADIDGDISGYFIGALNPFGSMEKKKVAFNALYITKVEPNLLTATWWSASPYALGAKNRVRYILRPCADKDFNSYARLPSMNSDEQEYLAKMNKYTSDFSPLLNNNPDFDDMGSMLYASWLTKFPFALRLGSQYKDKFDPKSWNYLRDNMNADLGSGRPGCFEFGVQAYQDEKTTPLRSPVAVWRSKPEWIARINIPAQSEISTPEKLAFCEKMSFNPWHALPEHKPVGNLNAMRGMIYKAMSTYRHRANQSDTGEPLSDYSLKIVTPFEASKFYR